MMNSVATTTNNTFNNIETVKTWHFGKSKNPAILKLREERNAKILTLHNAKVPSRYIAKRFNISTTCVNNVIRANNANGIARALTTEFIGDYPVAVPAVVSDVSVQNARDQVRAKLKERNERICNMRKDGMKIREIVETTGLSKTQICKILYRHEVYRPNKPAMECKSAFAMKVEARTEQMLKLRKEGMSNAEIAVKIGCCKGTVLRTIGYQPAEMSEANRKMGYQVRKLKNKTREDVVDAINKQPEPEIMTAEIPAAPIVPMVSDELVTAVAEKLFTKVIDALKGIA